MSPFFHFEEKIHRNNLSRAEAIPLLFPQLLSYVLEHLGFPPKPHRERCCVCEPTFTVEKWQFVLRAPPLLAFPLAREAQQVNAPRVQ